jgi:predicted amidohydrolase YtcJ
MTGEWDNRRNFIKRSGSAFAGLAVGRQLAAASVSQDADLVVLNAKVHTVDPQMPFANAVAVKDGRFVAVGTNEEVKAFSGKRTQTIDARQMTAVPGFIDCHNHATGSRLLYDVIVGNPYEVEFVSIASIVEKLRARAERTPPGFWVEGYFYDDTKVKDNRPLNLHDLDQVSAEHPVMVEHRGGHTGFYNSKALKLAGISRNIPNPPGGTFDRDAGGELNGRVTDRARAVFDNVGKRQEFTPAEQAQRNRDGQAYISKQFVRYGVCTVHHGEGQLAALQQIRRRGELLHRVSYEAAGKELNDFIDAGIRTGFGDEWIRIGATAEFTIDGSFSERTMALSIPYPGVEPPYRGNITINQEDLNAWVERIHRAGIQVNCHANGDVAIGMFLTAVERAQQLFPQSDARPKITHCTLVNDDLVRRMRALAAVPALFTSYAYYNSDKFHFYGEPLMQHCMAFRSLLDAGVRVAAGSDFPPGPFDPRMALQGMVTRTGWNGQTWGANQRISVTEALAVNTINGAYNSHEEAVKGSIAAGKFADFVMLSDDIFTMDKSKIKDVQIVRTVVGGKTVYSI